MSIDPDGSRPASFIRPRPVSPGDDVAVVAPSSGLAALFPDVLDLACDRLSEHFDVNPVIYRTAERGIEYLEENPAERAEDVHRAFRDPKVTAVFATIGGIDQIRVLKHLDPEVLRENPTRFFGTSDNACLANYLWQCGVVSYYGGTLLSDVATPGHLHGYTERYLERALFEETLGEVEPAEEWTDDPIDWASDDYADTVPEYEDTDGWRWELPDAASDVGTIEGRLWGGNLRVLQGLLAGDRAVPTPSAIDGDVLAIETSEELPSPDIVGFMLTAIGERGLLKRFDAVLVGRPQTRSHERDPGAEARERYRQEQRTAIAGTVRRYNPEAPIVFDFDIGHTTPVAPVPIGDRIQIDSGAKTVVFPE